MADFKEHLLTIISHGTLSISIALGIKLGIFDELANFSEENPATAERIAEQLDLKPRYVFEWLSAMVCGDIIEADKEGKKFWISETKREFISGSKEPIFALNVLIPILGEEHENVAKVFKKDGPPSMTFHSNPHMQEVGHVVVTAKHGNIKKYLLSDYLPKLGVREKLEEGIDVLDVGCGVGMQVLELAHLFPKSRFIGFDLSDKSIEQALKHKNEKGLENVEFLCMDAKEFKLEWDGKFDLIISFDAYIHMVHPEQALEETYRVLKSGGLFALTTLDGTDDNSYDERKSKNLLATLTYNMGLYQRKPEEDLNKAVNRKKVWTRWPSGLSLCTPKGEDSIPEVEI
uniref:Methyltransferase domain-containing protein n=1 Tax=Acrobeloides nanus TaxID=290746 RepID=A0A914DH79_9BILA